MMHDSYLLEPDGTRQKPGDDPKKPRGSRPGKTIHRSRDYQVNDDQQGKENENDLERKVKKCPLGCRIYDRHFRTCVNCEMDGPHDVSHVKSHD
jgi:hypothetical protein